MEHLDLARSDATARGRRAEAIVKDLLGKAGWEVDRSEANHSHQADLVVRRGKASYAVEVKAASEGRGDRLIPLWSQAYLEATRSAGGRRPVLAVVAAPRIAPGVAGQVLRFAGEYAPNAAAGVIDFAGLRLFRGRHLEGLDSESRAPARARLMRGKAADLFSDLNQWMLKTLVAPELPNEFLAAPRARYRNASQLARAAKVSVMSASRFVRQLEQGGYLHESQPYLTVVRREDLFRRWQASAVARPVKEVAMRFLLRRDPRVELQRMLRGDGGCLALFAAAEALGIGLVHGVPPHVHVQRLDAAVAAWKSLVPAERDEVTDVILRQAPAPQSVFRGAVRRNDVPVSDILQIWLDVGSHPSRGQEQGELIRRRVLDAVIAG